MGRGFDSHPAQFRMGNGLRAPWGVMEEIIQSERREPDWQRSVAELRQVIEVGWQQSESGEVVDGPSVFAEIRKMSDQMRASTKGK